MSMATLDRQRLSLVRGDITAVDADMIVNAANAGLCGGGGVDGAIHRAAGPRLLEHCRALGGARPGDVVVTPGFDLRARFIAHAVGPVWRGGDADEEALLRRCYTQACALAADHDVDTLAFPSISTGAYRFPIGRAAGIALDAVITHLATHARPARVVFVLFSDRDLAVYTRALDAR
jgi:O-acetyl-ADP-ribose deacetylase (regulator of RNase III)